MEPGASARNVLTQLRRGTIEYCVLAVLADGAEYAFELVRRLSAVDGLVTSEGTIYPLLARLRRDGLVTTSWQESDAGPAAEVLPAHTRRAAGAGGLHRRVDAVPGRGGRAARARTGPTSTRGRTT